MNQTHNKRRSTLTVPRRNSTTSTDTRQTHRQASSNDSTTEQATSSASPKKTIISRIRTVLFTKKGIIITCIVIVAVVAGVWIRQLIIENNAKSPEYATILPEGKPIKELGGWTRISPPENDPVFAYSDTITDVPVSVSQQPLPQSFRGDTDTQVADLAKKFNATTKIDAGGIAVYIGTSSKGPQSVILTKNDLLILIKSQKKIDNKAWAKYVTSLYEPGSNNLPKY